MRISIENFELRRRYGDKKAIEMIKEAGFDALDYSFYDTEDDPQILGDGYIEHALQVRRWLDEAGIVCNQAHAELGMRAQMRFDVSEPQYQRIVRCLKAAAILGAKQIVVHGVGDVLAYDAAYIAECNLAYYQSLIPYCEKFGIRVAVENLLRIDPKRRYFRPFLGTPQALGGLVTKLSSKWIVGCIDVGHAALTYREPEEFIKEMAPGVVQALHVHDNDYLDDRHMLPFTQNLNWPAIMAALKEYGYQGDLTFELSSYMSRIPDGLMTDAVQFANRVGRYLVSLYEGKA